MVKKSAHPIKTIIFSLLFSSMALFVNSHSVSASNNGTATPPGSSGSNCSKNFVSTYDRCFGASWRKYRVYSNDFYTPYGNAAYPKAHITGCLDDNDGDEYYYLLAWEVYNPSVQGSLGLGASLGYQHGAFTVNYLWANAIPFNVYPVNTNSTSVSWAEAQDRFAEAVQYYKDTGQTSPFAYTWNQTAWFCWDPDMQAKSSMFHSVTSVSAEGQTKTSAIDAAAEPISISTTKSSVNITFSHGITYEAGKAAEMTVSLPAIGVTWIAESNGSKLDSKWFSLANPKSSFNTPQIVRTETVNVQLSPGDSKTVCRTTKLYRPKRNFTYQYPNPATVESSSSPDFTESSACVTVTNSNVVTSGNGGHFWADSSITVPAQNGGEVTEHKGSVSTKIGSSNRSVTIKLSTDINKLTVNFVHSMSYDDPLWNCSVYYEVYGRHNRCSSAYFPNIISRYTLTSSGDGLNSTRSGTFGTQSGDSARILGVTQTITLNVPDGTTKKQCQTLTHDSAYVPRLSASESDTYYCPGCSGEDCIPPPCYWIHNNWTYSERGSHSGTGTNELCVEVTNINNNNPSGPGPISTSTANSTIMYTGETADLSWSATAAYVPTRRLIGYQAISYLIPASVTYSSNKVTGNRLVRNDSARGTSRYNLDPCSWYRQYISNMSWCFVNHSSTASSGTQNRLTSPVSVGFSDTVNVPDYVGYKYCNAWGYHWQYYSTISYNGRDVWIPSRDYWTVYDAKCRTIAKKPSVSFWNGGIFTDGDVITSVADRYDSAGLANPATGSYGAQRYFGSWVEHLASIAGINSSSRFGSGASLSRGSNATSSTNLASVNDRLTIANESPPSGDSNIHSSSTFHDVRLVNYLKNYNNLTSISSAYGTTSSGTKIIRVSGDLTITDNIQIADGPYGNIYTIPQVLIFVDGSVKITNNVTRIDAWLIASGSVDTCSNFASSNTQTLANGWNANRHCDNQLTFNGPVIASDLKLNRTYGADPIMEGERYTSAEIFNLSATTYLWAYTQAGRYNSSYTEAYSRELAPRY